MLSILNKSHEQLYNYSLIIKFKVNELKTNQDLIGEKNNNKFWRSSPSEKQLQQQNFH